MADASKGLKDTLLCAKEQNRVKYGILEAAKAMESPDNVMLCILTVDNIGDVTTHMFRTLMEAFCCENEIRVIKVCIIFTVTHIFSVGYTHVIKIPALFIVRPLGDLTHFKLIMISPRNSASLTLDVRNLHLQKLP